MNLHMTDALVDHHIRDIHGLAGLGQPRAEGKSTENWPRLRRRVGLTLIEAGLHLLATGTPVRSD
jgi:hypothetical protein